MRRAFRVVAWGAAGLLAVVVLLLAVVIGGSNTGPGRRVIEALTPRLTGGLVRVSGLSGWILGSAQIQRLELCDTQGAWLTANNVALTWSPLQLLHDEVKVQTVSVSDAFVARRPLPSNTSRSSSSSSLPVRVTVDALRIDRLSLAMSVAGRAATLAAQGSLRLVSLTQGDTDLAVRRLDSPGSYAIDGGLDQAGVHLTLHAAEPEGGLISSLANLPAIGAITADGTLNGPMTGIATKLALSAGPLRASAAGDIDVTNRAADLTVSATAPAMTPRPDLSWQGVALQAHVHGPFTKPEATATLTLDGLDANNAQVHQITADVSGNSGIVALKAALAGVTLPANDANVLAGAPVQVTASVRLDEPDRPVTFTVTHPLFSINGNGAISGTQRVEAHVQIAQVAPLAIAGGIADVAGQVDVTLRATRQDEDTHVDAAGSVALSNAPGPTTSVLGSAAQVHLAATLHQQTIALSTLTIDSGGLNAGLQGTVAPGTLNLRWNIALANLNTLQPTVSGPLTASGTVSGAPDNLTVSADANGTVAAAGLAPGDVHMQLAMAGLPNAPSGTVTATGALLGAPLNLALSATRRGGTLSVDIQRAAWKSASIQGQLQLPPRAVVPTGHLSFAMTRLADLAPLLARGVAGSITGTLDGTEASTHVALSATSAGLTGTATVAKTVLDATVSDPTTRPNINARLQLDGIAAAGVSGGGQLTAAGTLDALAVRVTANAPALAGSPTSLTTSGTVDVTNRVVRLATLQAECKQLALRLLAPTRIDLANGVALDRVRLGLGQAVLEANGRVSPTLDLTARLQNLPANLAKQIDPTISASGTIDADARLTGAPARPNGTIHVTGHGLRMANGAGSALPPVNLSATTVLQGVSARIDARANAGASHLAVNGTADLGGSNSFDLRTSGLIDLAMTDPLLTPNGRRARGRLTVDATVTGTPAAPRVSGTARLADGAFRDFVQGIDLSDIVATVQADGGTIRIAQLSAKAGPGTIGGGGSVDLTAPGVPVDLTITAKKAQPLANDLLTANLDAHLTVRGNVAGPLTLGGSVFVRRAEIQLPEKLPSSVAVLNVRVAGAPPPPPAPPSLPIALNLTVDAPEQIFVRGRGVDAELGGKISLTGTSSRPLPSGGFNLRHGTFSIVGQTLSFTSGDVSFNGGGLTDPSLDFISNVTAGDVVATLTIGGSAQKPKITLSSTPPLPQDEVLAYLLYGERTSQLSPLEVAQIAVALASLTGATSDVGNPLDSVRQALGLDRLSVGAGNNVEAGRYVARNVYVGARQSVTGSGAQGVVQVDLTKHLKLEATAGSAAQDAATNGASTTGAGATGNAASIGITYQFQY